MSDFDYINHFANETNSNDFEIYSYDSFRLRIVGSFDHCYYHEVEVFFEEVEFFLLPQSFSYPTFRMATEDEKSQLSSKYQNVSSTVYCIESEGELYFISAARMSIVKGIVHYNVENDTGRCVTKN